MPQYNKNILLPIVMFGIVAVINLVLWNLLLGRLQLLTNLIITFTLIAIWGLYLCWDKFIPQKTQDKLIQLAASFSVSLFIGFPATKIIGSMSGHPEFNLFLYSIWVGIVILLTWYFYKKIRSSDKHTS